MGDIVSWAVPMGERMIQVAPAITRVVEQLLKLDLIDKRQCQDDRRDFYVEIKSSALQLLNKIDQPLLDLHSRQLASVSPRDLKALIRILESVRKQSEE
ncbi:hypothetical protein CKO51_28340 [Rhodopirellula sp. SM50]|nr:hypothetical protein [Rhodopirellula sp. SM50]PAY16115.1 hypothetical protein CKO51_28340 [Rhodopirellula sp. SM50]